MILSNSYFTGNKAELGGRGDSKEKRHDRFIVTYGLVTNQDNMPLDIKIWKGGTADSKTS
jgi:transposase